VIDGVGDETLFDDEVAETFARGAVGGRESGGSRADDEQVESLTVLSRHRVFGKYSHATRGGGNRRRMRRSIGWRRDAGSS
jgi:hypothetical protein